MPQRALPPDELKKRKTEWRKRWDNQNLDRFSVAFPAGYADALKETAAALGTSRNSLIREAIDFYIDHLDMVQGTKKDPPSAN